MRNSIIGRAVTGIGAGVVAGVVIAAATAAGAAGAALTPLTEAVRNAGSPTAVTGSYIVVLKQKQTDRTRSGLTRRYGGSVSGVYHHAVNGYTARLTGKQASRLAADPAVSYVEQDQRVRVADAQSSPPSWGLDRIDQRNLPLNRSYSYGPSTGATVYVIDTGIRIEHQDFGGRASYGYDAVDRDTVAADGNGHGTFVAGVVAGASYGVAKSARVVAVRVLDNEGSGTTSGVIAGIDWVTANASGPSVANLSLGGGASTTLDAAVRRSINAGITYAIAAGNSGVNAANYSPARVGEALTVGATGSGDARASWSNYGAILDLFAPGVSITSAWRTGNSATYTGSGTSFAAPHVAGAAALYLNGHPAAGPAAVNAAIVAAATTGVVGGPGSGSPNRLLYTPGLGG